MHIKLRNNSLNIGDIESFLREQLPQATFSYLKRNIVIDKRAPGQRPSPYLIVEMPQGGRSKVFVYTGDIHIKNWPKPGGIGGIFKSIFGKPNVGTSIDLGETLIRLLAEKFGGELYRVGLH